MSFMRCTPQIDWHAPPGRAVASHLSISGHQGNGVESWELERSKRGNEAATARKSVKEDQVRDWEAVSYQSLIKLNNEMMGHTCSTVVLLIQLFWSKS
jgi:hypothetical protein